MSVLVRCDGCGALKWSLLRTPPDAPGAPAMCEICGTELKLERRRPGRRFRAHGRERRDLRNAPRMPVPPA
jgi:hypothetical protein